MIVPANGTPPPEQLIDRGLRQREKYGRIHQEQIPKSRAFREDFTLVKMVPTWLRYFDARPESFSIVEAPLV